MGNGTNYMGKSSNGTPSFGYSEPLASVDVATTAGTEVAFDFSGSQFKGAGTVFISPTGSYVDIADTDGSANAIPSTGTVGKVSRIRGTRQYLLKGNSTHLHLKTAAIDSVMLEFRE